MKISATAIRKSGFLNLSSIASPMGIGLPPQPEFKVGGMEVVLARNPWSRKALASLGLPGEAETEAVVADAGRAAEAIRRPAAHGAVIPTTAPNNPERRPVGDIHPRSS